MIKYNSNTINDWYYNSSDIIKVYHNGAVCYYKIAENGSYKVCFAVVDDITQYHETEFEDVFDKATEKWYKLNNLNQYEKYGVYASGRTSCSAVSFTELTDIIAQSTTALTNHNITVTPAVGAFSKIRIDTTKSATTSSYCWVTFTPTPSGSEVLGINMSSIGAMNGYGNNKNYVTDANGSQTFAHWVDDNNTIVEIDIAALSNNQTSELYLLFYQENCNPAAFSFYLSPTDCVTTYEGKLTIDEEVSPLPYTELEWIEMPQTEPYCAVQLVDTYSAATNLYYDFKLLFNNLSDLRILGFANNSHLIGYHNNTIYLDINGSRKFTINGFTTNTEYHFGLGYKNNSYVFENIDSSTTYATFNTPLPKSSKPYFGAVTVNGTIYVNGESERIYSVKVYDDGVLVGDYIPVKRNSDDFVTLYDLISEQYCNTTGGGTMVAGPTVTPTSTTCEFIYSGDSWVNVGEVSGSSRLPAGYTEVEYITSENLASGITGPYIDTNFTPNQNTRVVLDYQAIVNGQNNRRIFGSGRFNNTSSGNYIWSMENRIGQSNCYYYYKFDNGSSWKTSTLHPDLNRHVVDFNKEGKIWLDDTAVITLPSTSFTCSYNLGLFNEINSGAQTLYEYFQGRVYSCQVYDNGTMVRDLVPCKNSSDVAGMYDLVNDVFYSSASQSYQFEAGSSVAPPIVLPINYDEKSDPLDNLTFSTLTEAQTYAYNNCVYDGMKATIDGKNYVFDSEDGWVEKMHSLPNVPFMLNYNAKEYDASTKTLPKTEGQLRDSDAVCNYGYHIVDHSADGYITVTGNTRMVISGTPYFNRTNTLTGCTMTIVSKVKTTNVNESYSILTNRGDYGTMNWMWRYPSNGIFLHGSTTYNSPKYFTSTTEQPITASIRISYDGSVKQLLNDWTNNGSYNGAFQYGPAYSGNNAMFCDYTSINTEFWKGDFYWVYMSQEVLTDEQIQQVIDYNENL